MIFFCFVLSVSMSSVRNKCYKNNAVSIKLSLCGSYDKCLIVRKKPSACICNLIGCSVPISHKETSALLCQCPLTHCFRQMHFSRGREKSPESLHPYAYPQWSRVSCTAGTERQQHRQNMPRAGFLTQTQNVLDPVA